MWRTIVSIIKSTKTGDIYCNRCKWYRTMDELCEVGERHPLFVKRYTDHKGRDRCKYINDELYSRFFPHARGRISRICEANKDFMCPFFVRRWYILWGPRRGPRHIAVDLLGKRDGE